MRAIHCQTRTARLWRRFTKLVLILPRTKSRDDLQESLTGSQRAVRVCRESERRVLDRVRHHSLVRLVRRALDLSKFNRALRVEELRGGDLPKRNGGGLWERLFFVPLQLPFPSGASLAHPCLQHCDHS